MFILTQGVLGRFWGRFTDFLPDFFAGLIILGIGLTLASLLKKLFLTLITFIKLDSLLQKTKLASKNEVQLWTAILAEILRWTIIILFLIPTLETWHLSQATVVLNQLLFYLPNVIIAVIIGFIGMISANLISELVKQSSAKTLAIFSRSTIIFFTILVMMNQLGVAQDLIKILFTGIVAMITIAGGLAFGLGGKDIAKTLLETWQKKLENK